VVARRTVQSVAALISLTLLLAMGYFHYTYTSLDSGLTHLKVGNLGEATPAPGASSANAHAQGSTQNLLLIGSDSRAGLTPAQIKALHVGASDPTTSTDTLLIVHIPAGGAKATLISIPRDSYVPIPGFKSDKINAAYIDGYTYGTDGFPVSSTSTVKQRQAAGLTLLIGVIKTLTGLDIDHYAMVSFLGFYDIASAIGGISVNLCHAVDDTSAYNEAHGEGDVGSGFDQTAGHHDLTPVETLQFVRQRHNLVDAQGKQLNDLGREARQRYFLAAAFTKVASAGTLVNPGKLKALTSAIKKTLTLDPDLSLQSLADQLIGLSGNNIGGDTIPTEGSKTFPSPVGSALIVDPAKVQAQIQKWLNPAPASPSSSSVSSAHPSSTTASSSSVATVAPAEPKGCIN
jgi:LCP family protein required for cell wall assembly